MNTNSYTTQLCFAHALSIVRAIPPDSTLQPTAADKLRFYGLYKQATEGDLNMPRPSSKQIVDYAKWKSWHRMKGLSPIEAQRLYVDSLIQLLAELIHRYPHHPQSDFLKDALNELQFDEQNTQLIEEEDSFQDAYDPAEFELQEHFLNHFEADQLMNENVLLSPPASSTQFSFKSPHRYSFSSVNATEYPLTPIASPGHHSHTGQWVQGQTEKQPKTHRMPIEIDTVSETDVLDKEVAKVTSNLSLSSPYGSLPVSSNHEIKKGIRPSPSQKTSLRKKSRATSSSTTHTNPSEPLSSSSLSSLSSSSASSDKQISNRAIEKLQTELTALTEQMDQLRRNIKTKEERDRRLRRSPWYVFQLLVKHLAINSAISLIVFYVLWKRKSPLADKVIWFLRPWIQNVIRNILRKIVFWKVTA